MVLDLPENPVSRPREDIPIQQIPMTAAEKIKMMKAKHVAKHNGTNPQPSPSPSPSPNHSNEESKSEQAESLFTLSGEGSQIA